MRMFPHNGRQLSLLNQVTMAAKMSILTQSHSLNVYIRVLIHVPITFTFTIRARAFRVSALSPNGKSKVFCTQICALIYTFKECDCLSMLIFADVVTWFSSDNWRPFCGNILIPNSVTLMVTYLSGACNRLTNCHDDGGRKQSVGICKIVT